MAKTKSQFLIRTCAAYMLLRLISYAKADSAEEKQKCVQQLEGVTTCLPYVGGEAKAPTPDCCNGLKVVIKNNQKCVCMIVKDGNDPDLGLKINITLTLTLPSLCKAAENLSQCPALLHLDPNSPEAQVFNQMNKTMTNGGIGGPISSPNADQQSSPGGTRTSTTAKSDADCYNGKRLLAPQILVAGLLVWLS